MKLRGLISLVLLQILSSHAAAVELRKIPRTIGTEPAYQTQPKYCLLVFGPGAATRVWLVHDGDRLYADLNGDGDLTDPAERIAPHEESDADDGVYRFEVGDVREENLLHKLLSVRTLNLEHRAETVSQVGEALKNDPETRFYQLGIHLQMPLHRGAGIGGRVEHLVGPIDTGGVLKFSDTPEAAPIVHFGGPWQITIHSGAELTAGRETEVFLAMGTSGLGSGTTAFAAHEKLVPAGVYATLHVTLPGDDEPMEYVLRERCCTVSFHGGVRLADETPAGEATVRITLDDWLGGSAASTTHQVQVVQPEVKLALEPVSPRLKRSLMHPSRDEGMIVGIRYSPDGTQLVAGNYPGGVIQLWDVKSGDPLATLETGPGMRSSSDYFQIAPDWEFVCTPPRKRTRALLEREGKRRSRWEFEGAIRCWNLATGELQWQLQDSPPRGIIYTVLSPDGRYVASFEELPAETDGHPERRVSLWNAQTRTRREFSHIHPDTFSADSTRFAAGRRSEEGYVTALEVYDVETGQRMLSIPITDQPAWAQVSHFTPDGTQLIGDVTTVPDLSDQSTQQSSLKFWNAVTGEETGSITAGNSGESFSGPGMISPDGRTLALGSWRGERAKLYLIDITDRQISKTVDLGENLMIRGQAFSPDGRWIAASTQSLAEKDSLYGTAKNLRQPRIHLIEVATGVVRETIVAPQSFPDSLCFSPDGQTLASSGPGRVLLWDLSTPPGELNKYGVP